MIELKDFLWAMQDGDFGIEVTIRDYKKGERRYDTAFEEYITEPLVLTFKESVVGCFECPKGYEDAEVCHFEFEDDNTGWYTLIIRAEVWE